MSQAEALLNSLTASVIDHTHEVPDSDAHFTIDPYTREIVNVSYNKTVLMQGDHNSERFTFEIPRYVDGHDMSLCNRVMVHFDNVGDSIENVHSDVAYMTDLRINANKPDTVISSWLIRREATQIVGILSFSLQYQCVEEDEITYEWNTDSYDEIEIRKSKQNGEAAVINYTNVLEQWRSQIFGAGDSVIASISSEGSTQVAAIQNESTTQQAAIELKGSETLASIPEDYTEVYNMAEEALRTKADGVVCDVEGEIITVVDSSDDYIRGLNLYGKSTQFSTTGKNLLIQPYVETLLVNNNVTFTINDDYSITTNIATAGATVNTAFRLFGVGTTDTQPLPDGVIPGETYTFSAGRVLPTGMSMAIYFYDSTQTAINSCLIYENSAVTFEVPVLAVSWYGYIRIAEGAVVSNVTVYPMIELGDTATDYEPYTGGMASPNPDYPQEIISVENPTIDVYGSNLLKECTGYSMTYNGVTCDYEGDGIYHIYGTYSGTNTSMQFASMDLNIPVDPTAKYTLSCELVEGTPPDDYHPYVGLSSDTVSHRNWMALKIDDTKQVGEITNNTLIPADTLENPTHINRFWIYAYNDTLDAYTADFRIRVWLTKSDEPMSYEPYTEQKLPTTCTIPGIPVQSGGNYTDSNGQQWICDEVDLERGVLVQRVYSRVFDGVDGETITLYAERENVYGFALKFADVAMQKLAHAAFCTHFENIVTGISSTNKECFLCGAGSATIYVMINKDRLTEYSVDAFKTWLSESPITVLFQLETPIETSLTAEEIETYKALKTNYPNTTVLNDQSAWMKVKYNANTKLYIANTVETGVVTVVEGVLNDTY